jgi:hypothetical protein
VHILFETTYGPEKGLCGITMTGVKGLHKRLQEIFAIEICGQNNIYDSSRSRHLLKRITTN